MTSERPTPEGQVHLMARTSGGLWGLAAVVGMVGLLLPGPRPTHTVTGLILGVAVLIYAHGCVTGWLGWEGATLRTHAIVTAASMPIVALPVWATGGGSSYLQPVLMLSLLYISCFFPPRMSAPLMAALVVAATSPIAYAHGDPVDAYALAWAATAVGVGVTMHRLKGRLLAAEARQHEMAHRDPLTDVANRRAFDVALTRALGESGHRRLHAAKRDGSVAA